MKTQTTYKSTIKHKTSRGSIKVLLLFFPRFGSQNILLLLFIILENFIPSTDMLDIVTEFPCSLGYTSLAGTGHFSLPDDCRCSGSEDPCTEHKNKAYQTEFRLFRLDSYLLFNFSVKNSFY